LIEVVLQSGGWPLVADEVPVIGTWTPQGGFKFNGVASGVYEWPGTAVLAAESDDSGGESDGEAGGVAEEKTGDLNDLDDASQGSEMDWQFDEKLEDLKLSDESSKGDGEEAGDLNRPTNLATRMSLAKAIVRRTSKASTASRRKRGRMMT
jgi:hypothetical protein